MENFSLRLCIACLEHMMATTEDTFRATLSNFKKRLTPREQDDFSFSTLEDVHKVIACIQSEHGSEKKMMNMTRLQSFLEAMDQFGQVIEVFLNASEFVAFIWGPLKFILQVWNNPKACTSKGIASEVAV